MTEKIIFVYELFLLFKYFRFQFIFYAKTATPWKMSPPLSQQTPLKFVQFVKLVPCVQFQKRENIQGEVLLLVKFWWSCRLLACKFTKSNNPLCWVYSCFSYCTNDVKLRKASHIDSSSRQKTQNFDEKCTAEERATQKATIQV